MYLFILYRITFPGKLSFLSYRHKRDFKLLCHNWSNEESSCFNSNNNIRPFTRMNDLNNLKIERWESHGKEDDFSMMSLCPRIKGQYHKVLWNNKLIIYFNSQSHIKWKKLRRNENYIECRGTSYLLHNQ